MALDPNIALGVKPLEIANPLAQYGQMAQLQNYQNQNALAQYQLGAAQRAEQTANTQNELYAKHFNPATGGLDVNALIGEAAQRGQGGIIPNILKSENERQKAAADLSHVKTQTEAAQFKLTNDKLKHGLESLTSAPTPQDAIQKLNDGVTKGFFDMKTASAEAQKLQKMTAEDYQKYRIEKILGLVENKDRLAAMLPKVKYQEAGGSILGIQDNPTMPGYGLPIAGMAIKKTATPGELMVDARARQRLDQEMATGTLTPQSLDVAANVYLQTGQLPQGMGKSASGLRSQVMNRATELSTGKPAADVAGGIVEAKQDVASRGKAVKDFSTGQQGKMVNSFNTAIDHLDTMGKLSDALQNGDIKAFNSLGNTIAAQTGLPAPTNFNAARQIVTTEVIKAINASGGGVTERQEAERNFASANSPEQLKGLISTYQNLLGGQLKSLNLQYENTTGRKDFDKKLTPAAQSVVSRVRGETPTTTMSSVDQQAAAWAAANPTDPRAAQIKQRLGR
jgi:hypothetical protein